MTERARFADPKDENRRIILYYDEEYSPAMWADENDPEQGEFIRLEMENLESGEWVALGRVVEVYCPRCKTWSKSKDADDSLCGIVVDNSDEGDREAAFGI